MAELNTLTGNKYRNVSETEFNSIIFNDNLHNIKTYFYTDSMYSLADYRTTFYGKYGEIIGLKYVEDDMGLYYVKVD